MNMTLSLGVVRGFAPAAENMKIGAKMTATVPNSTMVSGTSKVLIERTTDVYFYVSSYEGCV
jgi:hypothetical protein